MTPEALQQRLDHTYRYQRHVYNATRAYYLLGRDKLICELNPPRKGSILEIGCGTARNLIKMAQTYPATELFGVDLSTVMLETAARNLRFHGLAERIGLAHGDATCFEPRHLFGRRAFDRIIFSYALSMIPPWQRALDRALGLLAAGAELHIVDFGTGDGLPSVANHTLRAWLSRFHVTPRDNLVPVLRRMAAEKHASLIVTPLYRGYAIHCVLAKH